MKLGELQGVALGDRADVFKSYLESLPADEVITAQELESATGRRFRSNVNLEAYSLIVNDSRGIRRLFGNPKAIKALQKQLANENRTRG